MEETRKKGLLSRITDSLYKIFLGARHENVPLNPLSRYKAVPTARKSSKPNAEALMMQYGQVKANAFEKVILRDACREARRRIGAYVPPSIKQIFSHRFWRGYRN